LATKQEVEDLRKRLEQDERTNTDLQADLKVVTDKLTITQGQLKKARMEAQKADEDTSEKLTALNTSVHTELATKASSEDIREVDTKVAGVKTDIDTTREDLKLARSEMGTLVARNHDEIDQLRRVGERDYIEFTISSKDVPQRVGNVTIELKDANAKRGQFTVNIAAEDRSLSKKNCPINEPIFFYLSGTKIPEELVVNKVSKDTISGYVSIPKTSTPN
jgi:chromosome segregation ATPase